VPINGVKACVSKPACPSLRLSRTLRRLDIVRPVPSATWGAMPKA
jgi:hypothetical protein